MNSADWTTLLAVVDITGLLTVVALLLSIPVRRRLHRPTKALRAFTATHYLDPRDRRQIERQLGRRGGRQ